MDALRTALGNLTRTHAVDLVILAECSIPAPELLATINQNNPQLFEPPDPLSQCPRITIYPRFASQFLTLLLETSRFTARRLRLPGQEELVLFAVHLRSKLHRGEEDKASELANFSLHVRRIEDELGHRRTFVIGDLNADPFEPGLVKADALHAVMTRELATRRPRTVQGNDYQFFYNPMWSHFGDRSHEERPPGTVDHEPPGTYYYPATGFQGYFWHLFDQVLLRPELLPRFRNRDLKILATDGETSLLDGRGLPDGRKVSDHLPLLVRLED